MFQTAESIPSIAEARKQEIDDHFAALKDMEFEASDSVAEAALACAEVADESARPRTDAEPSPEEALPEAEAASTGDASAAAPAPAGVAAEAAPGPSDPFVELESATPAPSRVDPFAELECQAWSQPVEVPAALPDAQRAAPAPVPALAAAAPDASRAVPSPDKFAAFGDIAVQAPTHPLNPRRMEAAAAEDANAPILMSPEQLALLDSERLAQMHAVITKTLQQRASAQQPTFATLPEPSGQALARRSACWLPGARWLVGRRVGLLSLGLAASRAACLPACQPACPPSCCAAGLLTGLLAG